MDNQTIVSRFYNIEKECGQLLDLANAFEATGNFHVSQRLRDIIKNIMYEADCGIEKYVEEQQRSLQASKELASLSLGAALKHFSKEGRESA